jgi:hypothetical protein
MPKPRPVVLTPEQKARAIDLRNEQARTRTAPVRKGAPKPSGGTYIPTDDEDVHPAPCWHPYHKPCTCFGGAR